MRDKIKQIEKEIKDLQLKKHTHILTYLKQLHDSYIFITDHAKVRYLERHENLLLLGSSDKERLLSAGNNIYNLRERMLSKEEEKRILLNDLKRWHKGDVTYVIGNLAIITVIKNNKRN